MNAVKAGRPLRVLFFVGSMGGGGSERQFLFLLKHLDRTRFQPVLYLSHRKGELLSQVPDDVPIYSFWEEFNFTLVGTLVTRSGLNFLARWWHLAHIMRLCQIDVIYNRTYLATFDAVGATHFRKTPCVSGLVANPEVEVNYYRRLPGPLSWWLARYMFAASTIVAANSRGVAELARSLFQLDNQQVVVLPNVLDHEQLDRWAAEHAVPHRDDRTTLITLGRLHHQKAHDVLLRAMAILVELQRGQAPPAAAGFPVENIQRLRELPTLCLRIFGQGPEEQSLRTLRAQLGLADVVEFNGFTTRAEGDVVAADLFVFPSRNEGMPNALIEACALGVPVVAADCPFGPSEILDRGRFGLLVPVEDHVSLARACLEALAHPEAARARADAARQHVRSAFSPKTVIAQFEGLLQRAAATASRSAR